MNGPARANAEAKINLGLVVGPLRPDGLHEVATVLQRVGLSDTVTLEPARALTVEGYAGDTLVRRALLELARVADVDPCWKARIEKRIPVAAGLGGGSSDAATALRLGNSLLERPLPPAALAAVARGLGSDVPFFLEPGPKLATGDGTTLEPLELPQDYTVLLLLPRGSRKPSTASVYARFSGAQGFDDRRRHLRLAAAAGMQADLGAFPGNDLVSSPYAARLRGLGAFRAEVSGAGPIVYGLFADAAAARRAAAALEPAGETWLVAPAW